MGGTTRSIHATTPVQAVVSIKAHIHAAIQADAAIKAVIVKAVVAAQAWTGKVVVVVVFVVVVSSVVFDHIPFVLAVFGATGFSRRRRHLDDGLINCFVGLSLSRRVLCKAVR